MSDKSDCKSSTSIITVQALRKKLLAADCEYHNRFMAGQTNSEVDHIHYGKLSVYKELAEAIGNQSLVELAQECIDTIIGSVKEAA